MSIQNFVLKKYLRHAYKPRLTADLKLEDARREQEALIKKYMPDAPKAIALARHPYGDLPCQVLIRKDREVECLVLYIHGGLFVMGSPASHLGVTAELATQGPYKVVVPEYSLAPESPYPVAINELVNIYQSLQEENTSGLPVVVMGDQAGACLAFLLALKQRGKKTPAPPAALVGLSGFFDLSLSSPSMVANLEQDCMYTYVMFERAIDYYIADKTAADSPSISPLFAELDQFPPVLLQVSNTEMLLDDSVRMAEQLKQYKVPVELKIWDDVPSGWQLAAMALPEGRSAIEQVCEFIQRSVNVEDDAQ